MSYGAIFRRTLRYGRPVQNRLRFLTSNTWKEKFTDDNRMTAEAEKILSGDPSKLHSQHSSVAKALSLLQQAVKQNSPRAKTLLGSLYNVGLAVHRDVKEASRLFTEAAQEGDPVAQCRLGVLKLQDINDTEEGLDSGVIRSSDFLVDVDEKGDRRGRLLLNSKDGNPPDDVDRPADLVRRVRKARRKAGFTDQQAREFEEHMQQQREEKLREERETALSWLSKAIQQEDDEAMVVMGNQILNENPVRAMELYELAIKTSRNTDAYFNLGQIYTKGLPGISPDSKAALKNFAMAAQLGDASAQFYLGHLYRVGASGVEIDHASSRQYIELAAKQGHPGALFYLALMHWNGEGGLEPNQGAFRRYLQQSADAGYGPAFSHLGEMHFKGSDGVEVDYEKALKYFQRAGELGEGDAWCSAAAMHFHGFGTPEDAHEAFLLYQEAAQLGNIQALRSIGSMYFHGHGIPANKKVAEHFFKVADENEQEERREGERHMQSRIDRTPAPKHPMADVPRFIKDSDDNADDNEFREK